MHVICTRRSRIDIIITRPRFPSLLVENTNRSIPRFLRPGCPLQRGRARAICSLARHRYRGNSSSSYVQQVSIPPPPSAVLLPTPSSPSCLQLDGKICPPPISLLIFRLARIREEGGEKRFLLVAGAPYVTHFFPVITALDKGISRRRLIVDQR